MKKGLLIGLYRMVLFASVPIFMWAGLESMSFMKELGLSINMGTIGKIMTFM